MEKKYATQSRNAFINAAMRFYLAYAERGVDGNLSPYTLENGPKLEGDVDGYEPDRRPCEDQCQQKLSG